MNSRRRTPSPSAERVYDLSTALRKGKTLRYAREDHTHGSPDDPAPDILRYLLGTTNQIYILERVDGYFKLYLPQDIGLESAVQFGSAQIGDVSGGDYAGIDADGILSFNGLARVNWSKITANGVTLGGGPPTSADAVADLQTAHDGNVYTVTEIANNPGQYLIVDFANVDAFNWVQLLLRYSGSSTHALTIALEVSPFDLSTWHTYNMVLDQPADQDYQNYSFFVPDDSPYINSGVVKVKISHEISGIAGHTWPIDVVALYQ